MQMLHLGALKVRCQPSRCRTGVRAQAGRHHTTPASPWHCHLTPVYQQEKEREQRQKSTEALEASMMRQDRGRKPLRSRVHKKLLASTVSEDKLDKLMLGRVDEDEKAIATLSNAVYKLRSMDSQIKHYDRLRSY